MKALATLLLSLLICGTSMSVAFADPTGQKGRDYFEVSEETRSMGEPAPPSSAPGIRTAAAVPTGVTYTQELLCGDSDKNLRIDTFACDSAMIRCGAGDRGLMYNLTAHRPDGSSELVGSDCYLPQAVQTVQGTAPAPPRITPALVLRAFERVPLPESELVIQPPGGQTLVGLDTIFSTKAERFSETVTLLGRSVELDITPTSYRWRHGDSTEQTTDWPGQEWRRSASRYVTHLYEDTAQVSTSVDTTWSARFRVGDGPWQEVPGTVTIEGDPAPLRVRSATPHLVGASDR